MSVNALSASQLSLLTTQTTQTGAASDVTVSMLRKGLDQSQSEMAQLLQGLPAPQPSHLGSQVNTLA